MKILRINMRSKSYHYEAVPEPWDRLGGRGLIARVLLDEVPPLCDPLGRENKLIFASGLLNGYTIPSCDRISIGGKSPLTGGVKESNAGGTTGWHIARLGIKALIIEDLCEEKEFQLIHISPDGVRFEPAGSLINLGAYETASRLREKYGDKVGIALIGPAGEAQYLSACINNLDKEGVPSRVSGRGGMGAVMGSKGIKAIIFEGASAKMTPPVNAELLGQIRKQFSQTLLANPQVEVWRDYGTAANVAITNLLGCFPTRNFSQGSFEGVDNLSGEKLRDTILERPAPGTATHPCMPGCVIRCSNVFVDENGEEIVAPLEYETIGLMGGNLGIENLDEIGRLNWYANDLGVDSIELGAALGVAAEAGLFEFGNAEQATALIRQIYENTSTGVLLATGAAATGKALGVKHIPVVKGQAFAAYDPRTLKGTGITYATSPQGADHTAGFTMRAKVDHLDPEANLPLSRGAQINTAAVDSIGACLMVSSCFSLNPTCLKDLLLAIYGWEVNEGIQQEIGKNVIRMEREFNHKAGFTDADDRLPEWVTKEPLPPKNAVFDISDTALNNIFSDL